MPKRLIIPLLSPRVKANLDISALASDPETTQILIVGPGKLSAEQIVENERRSTLRKLKEISIIKQYRVESEFIAEAKSRIQKHKDEISKLRAQIAKERAFIKALKS